MPAPILKFVTIFEDNDGFGWTEIHYKQASGENPNLGTQLGSFVTNIVPRRSVLLPQDCGIVGTRVSYPRVGAIASLANRQAFPGDPDHESLPTATSLAVQMQNNIGTAKKIIHMRGLWKEISLDGEYFEAVGWKTRLDAFLLDGLVSGGFGWLTKDPTTSSRGNVTGYTVNADPRVTFTVAPTLNVLPAAGTNISVRFSKLNGGHSTLNRTLLCTVVDPTTLRTIDRVAAASFEAPGKYNYRATSFVGYAEQGSKSIGRRAAGRPLNRLPGRSRAQPLA